MLSNNKYYVSMTDKFLSGWGRATGKINKLVIECDSYEEAVIVQRNAEDRDEMKYINISNTKPYYNSNRYLVNYRDKSKCSKWFSENRPFK